MECKRKRSDSLEYDEFDDIPGFLYGKRSESITPHPPELSRRHRTRGVEVISLHVDSQVDRGAIVEGTISSLKQQGKRVVSNPKILGNNKGGQDLTFEWVLDYDYSYSTQDKVKDDSEPAGPALHALHPHTSMSKDFTTQNVSNWEKSDSTCSNTPGTFNSCYAGKVIGAGSILDPITLTDDECDLPEQGGLCADSDKQDFMVLSEADVEISQISTSNETVERMRNLFGTDDEESDSTDEKDDGDEDDQDGALRPILAIAPPLSPGLPPASLSPPFFNRNGSPSGSAQRNDNASVPPVQTQLQSRIRNQLTALSDRGRTTSNRKPLDPLNANIMQVSNDVKHILLPATPHGKARRIIASNRDIWSAVTMRGDLRFINSRRKYTMPCCSLPGDTMYHAEDVCLVGDTLVVGYGRNQLPFTPLSPQIQTFCLGNLTSDTPPKRICLEHRPHCSRGVRSLSAINDTKFFSGGYDKRIHVWTLSQDGEPDSEDLKVFFKSGPVYAIAYVREISTMLGASGQHLKVINIDKPVDVMHQISRNVRHIHPSQCPNIIAIEVEDLYEQVHVFDMRTPGFAAAPTLRFGRKDRSQNHYIKGSLQHSYFVRGYDGTILLWDFRNTKDVVLKLEAERDQPVVHTMFSGVDVVAFGKNVVSVYEKVV